MEDNLAEAFFEVIQVLKHMSIEDQNKIPKSIMEKLYKYNDRNSKFIFNAGVSINENKLNDEAKVILATFYEEYWCSEIEREQFKEAKNKVLSENEEKKKIKYSVDDMFKNNADEKYDELQENHYLVVQEKWYKIILNKIKNFFNIK